MKGRQWIREGKEDKAWGGLRKRGLLGLRDILVLIYEKVRNWERKEREEEVWVVYVMNMFFLQLT